MAGRRLSHKHAHKLMRQGLFWSGSSSTPAELCSLAATAASFSTFFGGIMGIGMFADVLQMSGWAAAKTALPMIALYSGLLTVGMMALFGLILGGAYLIDRYHQNHPSAISPISTKSPCPYSHAS